MKQKAKKKRFMTYEKDDRMNLTLVTVLSKINEFAALFEVFSFHLWVTLLIETKIPSHFLYLVYFYAPINLFDGN